MDGDRRGFGQNQGLHMPNTKLHFAYLSAFSPLPSLFPSSEIRLGMGMDGGVLGQYQGLNMPNTTLHFAYLSAFSPLPSLFPSSEIRLGMGMEGGGGFGGKTRV